MRTYITVLGDEWEFIAKKEMGGERYATKLMEANEAYRDTLIFPAGIELTIPDIESRIPAVMPPWKKGR